MSSFPLIAITSSLFDYKVLLYSILIIVYSSSRDEIHPAIMEDIITSIKRLASNTDEAGHQMLMDGLRDLSYSLETPRDTIERLAYAVGLAVGKFGFGSTDLFSTYKSQRSALVLT